MADEVVGELRDPMFENRVVVDGEVGRRRR